MLVQMSAKSRLFTNALSLPVPPCETLPIPKMLAAATESAARRCGGMVLLVLEKFVLVLSLVGCSVEKTALTSNSYNRGVAAARVAA